MMENKWDRKSGHQSGMMLEIMLVGWKGNKLAGV